jgi:hypothetical protein
MGRASSRNWGKAEYIEDIAGKARRKDTTRKSKL